LDVKLFVCAEISQQDFLQLGTPNHYYLYFPSLDDGTLYIEKVYSESNYIKHEQVQPYNNS